ncbi:Arm DNA-binding domain-containing protein [Duganella sp. LjRoot269]|jgi:hypothetical protein|uniref:Arm DNA-binding domain-containing protein n=1 Tax=Duganella sp. LjRoot269 TaxID=3342305 RepID=UPI003ED0E417
MAINTLTDADCRKATPNNGKLRKLFDGHGLMLAVLPSGNKVWCMAYRNSTGKQQTAVIGPQLWSTAADDAGGVVARAFLPVEGIVIRGAGLAAVAVPARHHGLHQQ